MSPPININEILEEIRRVNSDAKIPYLSFSYFFERQKLGLTEKAILRPFDGKWSLACKKAGVTPGKASDVKHLKNRTYSRDQIREKLERMSREMPSGIIGKNLNKYGLSMGPIYRIWGSRGLEKACEEFGLKISPSSGRNKELSLEHLAEEFLEAALDFSPPKIPSLTELCNRGSHAENSYSGKWNGYPKFKELAINHLLKVPTTNDPHLTELFRGELEKLNGKTKAIVQSEIRQHEHGRVLGFRAFAHVPTYEQDVVGMFAVVADELGFEIVSNRVQFPDCKANRKVEGSSRKRYKECLIEFELRSSDFKTHKHPVNGCDLIVCWEHDWKDCPLEVLELKSEIKKLSGWK